MTGMWSIPVTPPPNIGHKGCNLLLFVFIYLFIEITFSIVHLKNLLSKMWHKLSLNAIICIKKMHKFMTSNYRLNQLIYSRIDMIFNKNALFLLSKYRKLHIAVYIFLKEYNSFYQWRHDLTTQVRLRHPLVTGFCTHTWRTFFSIKLQRREDSCLV